ncbi:hypothetical protein B0H16DRAFT_1629040 [Mycena metata]|uniref:FAD/NAD(P)-binding domain-containing protein n=1 Tax=Mycena metata TaxID=1033252 RepID=A0AAD7H372_9AGAR|nr:hypothetical protein B0H16DRAFT_1629040 [Mycena metata]
MFLSKAVLVFFVAAGYVAEGVFAATQFPFQAPTDADRSSFVNSPVRSESQFYQFKWPIRKVAIIGAGVSGLLAYRELVDAGFDEVKIFERDAVPGGNWYYTDETAVEAPIPNVDPSIGDYAPTLPPPGSTMPHQQIYIDHEGSMSTAERWRRHRHPRSLWKSLTSNVPAPMMHFTGHPFPPGTPWNLPQTLLVRYIRSVYSYYGINSNDENRNISYSTRVELIEKRFDPDGVRQGWTLTLKELTHLGPSACKDRWWTEDFDAVVVATGTFNAPSIPTIPGLVEWRRKYPESISHSREYRYPEKFRNQTMLVIGAGPSATGISADLHPHVKRNYLSLRRSANSTTPIVFLNLLPQGVRIVPGIKEFHSSNHTIEFSDGTFLADVDHILFSTGYQYSFPFLPQYHNSSIGIHEEGPDDQPQPLVTDGSHYRSLYRNFLYIEEPTLGFLNMNLGTNTWDMGEYFALAYAKIWSGKAMLPSQAEMWKDYRKEVASKGGYGTKVVFFNSLEYTRFFTGWLNSAAVEFGGRQIDGVHPDNKEIITVFHKAFFANPNPVKIPFPVNLSDSFTVANVGNVNPDDLWSYLTSGY